MSDDDPKISAAEVKRLRDETGAGFMDVRRALTESGGDVEAARDLLRKWGLAGVEKRAARLATEGMVAFYAHQLGSDLPPKSGAMVELNCETDFVAKTDAFKQLGKDLAMHVTALEPRWVQRSDVPQDFIDRERSVLADSDKTKGKPPEIVERIVEGAMKSVFEGKGGVLMDQIFLKDESGRKTVAEVINDVAATVKENIVVRRFARFRVGEED